MIELLSFEKCFKDVTGGNTKVKQSDYLDDGPIPVIDQGRKLIGGYTDNKAALVKCKIPCVIFGDHSRNIKYFDQPFAIGADGVKLLEASEMVLPKFGYYFLQTVKLPDTGYDRSFKYLKRIKVPLPDLETQNKIIAVLDKANTLSKKREETIGKYDELLRSVFLDMFGDPIINPQKWPLKKLSELGTWKSGGTPPRAKPDYFKGSIPWYTSGELNSMFISNSTEYISASAVEKSNAKLMENGSILIGMYDTAAMKSSISQVEATCNQAIAYSKIDNNKCLTEYLYFAIQMGKEFFKSTQRGVRQQNLNLSMIKDIEVPIPSMRLQIDFVKKLYKIEGNKQKCQNSFYEFFKLSQALSQLAFSGKLTFNTAVELETLLNAIDLDKPDVENDITNALNNKALIRLLVDRLNKQDFESMNEYEKGKYIVFRILKDADGIIDQNYSREEKQLQLSVR